jgi:hypothetical protein
MPVTLTPSPPCVHEYQYQGVKYKVDDYNLPGSSAKSRRYYDSYFCTKCCKLKLVELVETDTTGHNIKFNATPVPYKH